MRRWVVTFAAIALTALGMGLASGALAQSDRVAYGENVHVARGEVVRDAISFGGNTVVEGRVLGDALSFGGNVELRSGAIVDGDVGSFGGRVIRDPQQADAFAGSVPVAPVVASPATVSGQELTAGCDMGRRGWLEETLGWFGDAGRSAIAHVLLFLLGLLLIGVSRDRLGALQVTMVRQAPRTVGVGALGFVGASVCVILLAVTIVGIPGAVVLAIITAIVTYVGLAAAATVIGAALPFEQLKGREVLQLGFGVAVLYLCSLVPWIGTFGTLAAALLGVGAIIRTRFRPAPPEDLDPGGEGPYREPART